MWAKIYGNEKSTPKNTLPFESTQHMLKYVQNYAETHALPLPAHNCTRVGIAMHVKMSSKTHQYE